jgi:DNA-nicking Smr family endonuclease
MNFGDILNQWDDLEKGKRSNASLEAWLDAKGVEDKDRNDQEIQDRETEYRRLSGLRTQAVLDLHGMNMEEAESAIACFIDASSRSGLEKVLVIHGKGLHSEGGVSVLKKTARRALEAHPLAGRFGEAAKSEGGTGALWVIIRK